jgi:O-antigen/teichoic acid export membrane protein
MLVAYPILVHHLGTGRFGIYFLATSVSGSVAFLDLGISSATLKLVAEDLARGAKKAVAETIVTSFAFYGGLGIFGAVLVWLLSPWLVSLFSVNPALRAEAIVVFHLAAIQLAVFITNTNLVSLFKGMQRFDQSTMALSLLSTLTFGGAIIGVTLAGLGLVGVTFISLAANLLVLLICVSRGLSLCRDQGVFLGSARPSFSAFRRMLGFGAGVSVHALTALFFFQGQRLLVGALINPAAVAVYILAATAASKAHAVVAAATEVMFPMVSATIGPDPLLRRLYLRMLLGSGIAAALILLPLALLAEQILTAWVGTDLALKAAPLLQVLAIGFFFMALSPAPFHVVNGVGRPWFNVFFDLCNVIMAASMLVLFALDGITLADFAWAVAIANVATALLFQFSVEVLIWRRGLLASEHSSEIES